MKALSPYFGNYRGFCVSVAFRFRPKLSYLVLLI